jgi:PAS domain S-box-containing protein
VSKGVLLNNSIVEKCAKNIAAYKQFIDIAYDPVCLFHKPSLTCLYYNTKFKRAFNPKDTSTLPDLLQKNADSKYELKPLLEDRLSKQRIERDFRTTIPCDDTQEFELTLSESADAQCMLCSIRQISLHKNYTASFENDHNQIILSSLKNYKKIIDSSPFAVLKTDMEGIITFNSSYSEYIHGECNSPLVGTHLNKHFNLNGSNLFDKLKKKLISQKKGNGQLVAHALNIHGNHKEVEIRYTLIDDENSQAILLNYYDISEQVRIKSNLRQSNKKIQSMLDLSSMPIIEIGETGIILNSSPNINQFFGIDDHDITGNSIYSIIKTENHASFTEFIQSILIPDKSKLTHTFRLVDKSGTEKVIQLSGNLIEDNNQNRHRIILICENITERLNSELALIEKDKALHTLLENSPFGIYAIDLNYNITFINKNAIQSFKQNQNIEVSIFDNLKDKIDSEEFIEWDKLFNRVFNGESFYSVGQIANNPNKIVNNRYAPLKDAFGNIIGCIEVSHDITSIKLKEYELLEREAYLNSILNSAPNAILVLDLNHTVTAINPEAVSFFKKEYATDLHKHIKLDSVIGSGIMSPYTDVFKRACKGEVVNFFVVLDTLGSKKYYDWTVSPVKDYTETIIGAKILIQDRSKKVESAKALIESELKYKQLLDVIPGGILMTRPNGAFLYASPAVHDMLGVPRHYSLENYGYKTFVPNVEFFQKNLQSNIINENYSVTNRIAATKRDGTPVWLDTQSKLVKYNKEDVILSVLIDVTKTVEIEKEKELNQKLYEILVESSLDGTDVTEIKGTKEKPEYTLLIRNERMKMFFNSNKNACIELEHLLSIVPEYQSNGELSKDVLTNDWKIFIENKKFTAERLIYNTKKELRNVFRSVQLIEFDNRTFLVRSYKDVTDLRKKDIEISLRASEIEKNNKVLQNYIESNVSLERFAYVTAHDLKSPIRTIISFAQLLERGIWHDLTPKNQTFLRIIIDSSRNMFSLVEDVLSYSQIGTEKLTTHNFYIDQFLEFQTSLLQEEINSHNASITYDININTIECDKIKLGQLLQNLVRNGIKFHKENEKPIVNISVVDCGDEWKFGVSDNGIGIKKEHQEDIFTVFKRLHTKGEFRGNGIGLSTCQKIVELWSGKIWVESEEGVGSTFYFTIPKKAKRIL